MAALIKAALPFALVPTLLAQSPDGKRTFPTVTMDNFHATMIVTVDHFGTPANPPPPNQTATSVVIGDRKKLILVQQDKMPDGRSSSTILDYSEGDGVMYQVQPFFNETVCYKLPAVQGPPGAVSDAKPSKKDHAWLMQLYQILQVTSSPEQDKWHKTTTKVVDGKTCTVWLDPEGTGCSQTACFDEKGNVYSTVFKQFSDKQDGFIQSVTFKDFRPATDKEFAKPTGCVDLTKPTNTVDLKHTAANDAELIRKANEEAAGAWQAAASPVFEGMSLADAAKMHGTRMAMPHLPLRPAAEASLGAEAIPKSFDSRTAWKKCSSISKIRNQGACGSCWAFAANEVFADRLCIGGGDKDFTGSVEYMIDCDKTDLGCQGGMLDDAWDFLKNTGVVDEKCDPYTHCPSPAYPQCKPPADFLEPKCGKVYDNCEWLGPDPVGVMQSTCCGKLTCVAGQGEKVCADMSNATQRIQDPPPPKCPEKCKGGSPLKKIKAKSAYMVSKPGDVKGMQQEIMKNGPVEVAFFVYSDFQTYTGGVYHRTASSQGPLGGHAVRVLGWGTEQGTDYWLVANSWSPQWGEKGYFKIRRGTNECGIETTPAAGLVDGKDTEETVVVI